MAPGAGRGAPGGGRGAGMGSRGAAKEAAGLLRTGDAAGALARLGPASKGEAFEVGILRGKALFLMGELEGARGAYEGAATQRPEALPPWQGLFEAYQKLGDGPGVVRASSRLVALALGDGGAEPNPGKLPGFALRLHRASKGTDSGGCVELLRRALLEAVKSGVDGSVECLLALADRVRDGEELGSLLGLPEEPALARVARASAALRGGFQELKDRLVALRSDALLAARIERGSKGDTTKERASLEQAFLWAVAGGHSSEATLATGLRLLLDEAAFRVGQGPLLESVEDEARYASLCRRLAHDFPWGGAGTSALAHLSYRRQMPSRADEPDGPTSCRAQVQRALKADRKDFICWWALGCANEWTDPQQGLQCIAQSRKHCKAACTRGWNFAKLDKSLCLYEARFLSSSGRFHEALPVYDLVAERGEALERAHALRNKSLSQRRLGLSTEALETLQKAATFSKDDLELSTKIQLELAYFSHAKNGPAAAAAALICLEDRMRADGAAASILSYSAFLRGRLYWKQGGEHRTEPQFMRAAMMEAASSAEVLNHHAGCFKWLGHYYARVKGDWKRAVKCFQKSVALDASCEGSGKALCQLLQQNGREKEVIGLCRNSLRRTQRASWALFPLAYQLLRRGDADEALKNLQKLLQTKPEDVMGWEALALAYKSLGRPTSALRSFQRTAELDPSRLSAVAEAGRLLLEMGETEEALSILQNSRGENAKQSTMLQIILASALKTQAECCFSDARLRGASELLSTASAALQNLGPACLGVASEVVHKLVGDVAVLLSQVNPGEAVRGARSVESSQSVLSARKAFAKVLHTSPFRASSWADVAFTYHLDNESQSSQQASPSCQAEDLLRGALRLEPENAESWAALGCAAKDKATKEFCLSKSLRLQPKCSEAWAALGQTYMENGEFGLAEECFNEGRLHNPSFFGVWTGSALSRLQNNGFDEECFRKFEHSYGLRGNEALSLLGFVSGSLLWGGKLKPDMLTVACKSLELNQSAAARNTLGLVQEALGQLEEAEKTLSEASARSRNEVAPRSGISFFSQGGDLSPSAISLSNLARVKCRLGKYGEVVELAESARVSGMRAAPAMQLSEAISLCEMGNIGRGLPIIEALLEGPSVPKEVRILCRKVEMKAGNFDATMSEILECLERGDTLLFKGLWSAMLGRAAGKQKVSQRLWDFMRANMKHTNFWDAWAVAQWHKLQAVESCLSGDTSLMSLKKALRACPQDLQRHAELLSAAGKFGKISLADLPSGQLARNPTLALAVARQALAQRNEESKSAARMALKFLLMREPHSRELWDLLRANFP